MDTVRVVVVLGLLGLGGACGGIAIEGPGDGHNSGIGGVPNNGGSAVGGWNTGTGGVDYYGSGGQYFGAGGGYYGGAGGHLCVGLTARGTGIDGLVDDLEDCNAIIPFSDNRAGSWWVTGNNCQFAFLSQGIYEGPPMPQVPAFGNRSNAALRVAGSSCGPEYGLSLSVQLNSQGSLGCAYDATPYDGVYFWARAEPGFTTKSIRFMISTVQTVPREQGGNGTCENEYGFGCWDSHGISLTLTEDWTFYRFSWADLKQEGWGTSVAFRPDSTHSLVWAVTLPDVLASQADFWVDHVGFSRGELRVPEPTAGSACGAGGAAGASGRP